MTTIFDHITSSVLAGILALTVARVQININSMIATNQHSVSTQSMAVELARQLEFDLSKIGYNVTGSKLLAADSTMLQFRADVDHDGSPSIIQYRLGQPWECGNTANPKDMPLYRSTGFSWVKQHQGLTQFRFAYYDSAFQRMPAPGTESASLAKVRAIKASFVLQSADPAYSFFDTTWAEVHWEKMILPRNLNNLNR